MIRSRCGKVLQVLNKDNDAWELLVAVEGMEQKAVNYQSLTGPVQVGDIVLLNTTAVYKKLGTGGRHFVMANFSSPDTDVAEKGHIMKLRYTPSQVKVLAVEEQESPDAEVMRKATTLAGMPVVAATLHSMLPPIAAAIYRQGGGKIKLAYVMTDGAALPLTFSKMVRILKQKHMLHSTITCGHAFGGDYEAVNIYSGLLAAKEVAKADVAVVAMGPGIVGTGSKYGYTGLEQGQVVNAVHTLKGQAVAVPRISFADARSRHYGLSHHTRTALGDVALARCVVTLPQLERQKMALLWQQLEDSGINTKHQVVQIDGEPAIQQLQQAEINVTTMGRTINQDREFFLSAGAAGMYAASLVK